ncbi:probable prefoldin subunit 4 [Chrysoperla carnea]|uniref:probable prefoldin subunit 4 n=1 Tax=Chrysoperla carnea TaxID=189513 RepID=UPI001D0720E8|nr:probable prefoldin subunit 4 [Chrysoperla carnea]
MSSTTKKGGDFQPDSDVHITFEDQQKINKFARHNAKMEDYKNELKTKENELKSLEEAIEETSLLDELEDKIPYLVGEVFIYQNVETTQKCLEEAKAAKESEIQALKQKCTDLKNLMSELKAQLYGKFGNHINLEAEDE